MVRRGRLLPASDLVADSSVGAASVEEVINSATGLLQQRCWSGGMEDTRTRKRHRPARDVGRPEMDAVRDDGSPATTRHESPPWREDDREGHFVFDLGENLTPRYKILSKMGEGLFLPSDFFLVILALNVVGIWSANITMAGTFGRVLECWDREKREHVAIKVVRSIRKYRRAAMIEIDVLNILARNDKGRSRCVQIRSWFDYRNHICIVFEKLGPSLFDFLKRNRYCPFPVDLVREFGRQLLESVAYMHDLRLIHTDLKPENILLVSSEYVKVPSHKVMHSRYFPKSSAIKLIDFGSTAFEDQDRSSIVSTRQYRAPEIILGIGWDYPCDLWSIGCILAELCMGEQLFQTHENLEHLAMMERVLGPLPDHMIRKANPSTSKYFKRGVRLNWPEGAESRESIRAVRKLDRLKDLVFRYVEHSGASLADLLSGLLTFEPSERLTAREALNHPFFRGPG